MEIRPLTVFLGPNSSGKSSIMQFLLAPQVNFKSLDIQEVLVLKQGQTFSQRGQGLHAISL